MQNFSCAKNKGNTAELKDSSDRVKANTGASDIYLTLVIDQPL